MPRRKISSSRQQIIDREYRVPVYIYGDGETEESYFNHLNVIKKFKNIRFIPKIYDKPKKFERMFQNEKHVYAVFDIDNHGKDKKSTEYINLENKLKKYKNYAFFANYSFETWILLHKRKKIPMIIHKNDYDSLMNTHFRLKIKWSKPDGKNKEQRDIVMSKLSVQDVNTACENAKEIENEKFYENPSTNINLLFEKLTKINDLKE